MNAVLVAFLMIFVQMGAGSAICYDLMSAESDQGCQVEMSKMASPRCHLNHCAHRCNLASQEKPFSRAKSTDKALQNPAEVPSVLSPVVMDSFAPATFLWSFTAKEPGKSVFEVYLLNQSFLI